MTCIQDERVLESGNYGETMLNNAWQNSKLRQLSATLYGYSIVDLTACKELNRDGSFNQHTSLPHYSFQAYRASKTFNKSATEIPLLALNE